MSKSKLSRLRSYAKAKSLSIDEQATKEMRQALSDTTITLRLPQALKEALKKQAEHKKIPYQRYIKNLLIEALESKA